MPSAIQAGTYAILLLGCALLLATARIRAGQGGIELNCLPVKARSER